MVEYQDAPPLDAIFHALGDATRRRMLQQLAEGERTVSQLAEPHQMSLAAASKHVKALEGAGLLQREVQGRTHLCRLNAAPLLQAHEWLAHYERFWHQRLDKLAQLLRDEVPHPATPRTTTPRTTTRRTAARRSTRPPTAPRKGPKR